MSETKYKKKYKNAKKAADYLATVIWKKYWIAESPNFELCDSVEGVISQIDNMISGLVKLEELK